MEPVLPDGSTIGVDIGSTDIKDGKVYAIDHDGALRVKQLYKLPNGGLRLRSFNRDEWDDENLTPEQAQHVRIIGRMFWSSTLW
jgi:phage repressor protein C with HTH and peptisase S24 domain